MVPDFCCIEFEERLEAHYIRETPEISPICDKNPVHAEIRVHKICVLLR